MSLGSAQFESLRDAIADAFDEANLVEFVRFRMAINLWRIVERGPINKVAFDLIRHFEQLGTESKLIQEVIAARRQNAKVKLYAATYAAQGASPNPTDGPPVSPWVDDLETGERLLVSRLEDSTDPNMYWRLAVVLGRKGQDHLPEARRHLQSGDDLTTRDNWPVERLLYGAFISFAEGMYDTAEAELLQFIWHLAPDSIDRAVAHDLMGRIFSQKGKPLDAVDWFQTAVRMKRRIGDSVGQSITLGNLGRLCLYLGEYRSAEEHFRDNLRLIESSSQTSAGAQVRTHLAEALLAQDRCSEGLDLLDQVLADATTSSGDRGFACLMAAQAHLLCGRRERARESLDAARAWCELVRSSVGLDLAEEVEGLVAVARGWSVTAQKRFAYYSDTPAVRAHTLYHVYRLQRRAVHAAALKEPAVARQALGRAYELAVKSTLPVMRCLERIKDLMESHTDGVEPADARDEAWLRFWRDRLPRPLALALPLDTRDRLSLGMFGEAFAHFALLATTAQLDDTLADRLPYRVTLGHLVGLLREALRRLDKSGRESVLPDASRLLPPLERFVQLRNAYVHKGDRADETGEEMRRIFADLVRYAGRTFRLQVRMVPPTPEVVLNGANAPLPEWGELEVVANSVSIPMSGYMRLNAGRLSWRSMAGVADSWVYEDGTSVEDAR